MTKKEFELLPWDEAISKINSDETLGWAYLDEKIISIPQEEWNKLAGSEIEKISPALTDDLAVVTFLTSANNYNFAHIPRVCLREIETRQKRTNKKRRNTMKKEGIFGKPLKETAKDRVKKELAELEEKIEKLSHALAPLADKFGTETEAYSLLNLQLGVMRTYANILLRRLAIWKD